MSRQLKVSPFYLCALASLFALGAAHAQVRLDGRAPAVITERVDDNKRVVIEGSKRHDIGQDNDRGDVDDDLPMEHMLLQLRHSPEQELKLQQFIDELNTPGSPIFHRWISAQEFGQNFGLAKQDLDTITNWLESHGFQINVVYSSAMVIDFSGTARQVSQAFQTPIHHFNVKGTLHIANVNNTQIPAALAPAIVGVVSLNDVRPVTLHKIRKPRGNYTFDSSGATYAMVPSDLSTIYNLNPLFAAGVTGQGQTIVLIEDTNVYSSADWKTFRSTFGLSRYSSASFSTIHPAPSTGGNNCSNPGVIAPNDAEAILDAEWASAAAPSATLKMASCSDTTTTFGGLIAIENLINSSGQPPAIMRKWRSSQCGLLFGISAGGRRGSFGLCGGW
jgi:subtilase family serine protease